MRSKIIIPEMVGALSLASVESRLPAFTSQAVEMGYEEDEAKEVYGKLLASIRQVAEQSK